MSGRPSRQTKDPARVSTDLCPTPTVLPRQRFMPGTSRTIVCLTPLDFCPPGTSGRCCIRIIPQEAALPPPTDKSGGFRAEDLVRLQTQLQIKGDARESLRETTGRSEPRLAVETVETVETVELSRSSCNKKGATSAHQRRIKDPARLAGPIVCKRKI